MCIMQDFLTTVQDRVEHYRQLGETMECIADRAGVSRTYLYNIINEQDVNPPIAMAERIAEGLGFRLTVTPK